MSETSGKLRLQTFGGLWWCLVLVRADLLSSRLRGKNLCFSCCLTCRLARINKNMSHHAQPRYHILQHPNPNTLIRNCSEQQGLISGIRRRDVQSATLDFRCERAAVGVESNVYFLSSPLPHLLSKIPRKYAHRRRHLAEACMRLVAFRSQLLPWAHVRLWQIGHATTAVRTRKKTVLQLKGELGDRFESARGQEHNDTSYVF